jgi:hypothetical protein
MGIDWDFNGLESLIVDRGDEVIWETGIACPKCRREDTIASFNQVTNTQMTRMRLTNCNKCGGYNIIYRNATKVLGLITSLNGGNRSLIDIGLAMPGDCVFSPSLRAQEMHDMDRVTMCVEDVFNEGQTIQRNAAHLSEARYVPTTLTVDEDRLWYASSGCSVWCEDEDSVVYDVGNDYQLIDNTIKWVGNRPADGKFYTLKYYYYPEWIVYASPLQRVDRGRNLQQRVLLRKKHVAFTTQTDKATPAQRQQEQLASTGRIKL